MREHLYRGKRIDNGEWIYGSLISLTQGEFIVTTDHYNTVDIDLHEKLLCNALWEDNDFVEVFPNTISEYTGLTDRNGVKIFEGDIIKIYSFNIVVGKSCKIGEVVFCKNGYFIKHTENGNDFFSDFRLCEKINAGMDGIAEYVYEYEVIGNIYDNPELPTDKLNL